MRRKSFFSDYLQKSSFSLNDFTCRIVLGKKIPVVLFLQIVIKKKRVISVSVSFKICI